MGFACKPCMKSLPTRAKPPPQVLPPKPPLTNFSIYTLITTTLNPTTLITHSSLKTLVFHFDNSHTMAELHYQQQHQYPHRYPNDPYEQQTSYSTQVVKAATAVTAGGSLLILASLILAGTIIALTIVTPPLVIFSPVLVPAVITVALLSLGFLASGGFGVAAITVLAWIYRYVTGKQPPGADQLDSARHKIMDKAREIKDYGQQQISGVQAS